MQWFTMHRLYESKTNSHPRWYFFCRAGESLREDAKMGQLTLRTGFIWSTSTGPQSIGMYERCTTGRSSCCKSWPSGSARWPSWTGSPWAPQSSLDSTQSSRWQQRGRFGRCRRWLFMEFVTILLFFFKKGHNWIRSRCWMSLPSEQERLHRQVNFSETNFSVHWIVP